MIACNDRIATPEDRVRELQRRLYCKAKQEQRYRFYSLYDKMYWQKTLSYAYTLVRANKGAPGVDGVTFEGIERAEAGVEGFLQAIEEELRTKQYRPHLVRRILIPKGSGESRPLGIPTIRDRVVQAAAKLVLEPIFEADFEEYSYGFRPKRNAHQAIADVTQNLRRGRCEVLDCDLFRYFETIPHDQLLRAVARRVVDKNILRLIKQWLTAPVVIERPDGKKEIEGGRRTKRGTPQGGVLSPLLANIHLHGLDKHWREAQLEGRLNARLVRYADDLLVLCHQRADEAMQELRKVVSHLGLTLNETKTRRVNVWQEAVTFLGFEIRMRRSPRTGKAFAMVRPSPEARKRIRGAIKERTRRCHLAQPPAVVIADLNRQVRGWVQYFYYGNCSQDFKVLRRYLADRVRNYLHRRRARGSWRIGEYPDRVLYERLGLYAIPLTAPWKVAPAHALR